MPQVNALGYLDHRWRGPQILVGRVLLLCLLIVTTGCDWSQRSEAQTNPSGRGRDDNGPPAVETAIARSGSVTETLEYPGTTEPLQQVSLRAQAEGQLLSIAADVGDSVQRGQVLAQIDDRILNTDVTESQAELAARESEVAQARSRVNEAQTQVERARVELQQAQADASRLQFLANQGAISQQEAELARTALRTSEQAVRSAQDQVATAQEAVVAAQGRVRAQQSVLTQSRERLSYTALSSPISGVVLERLAEAGDLVQTGGDVFRLADFSAVKVKVQISELELANVQVGQPVQVRLDAFPGREIRGEVTRISPAADPTARLIPVEVTIPNSDGRIGSGLLARVRFDQAVRDPIVIPESALEVSEDDSTIFIITGEGAEAKAEVRTVQLGDRANGRVEVRSGLEAGEAFVVRSSHPLQDGQSVKLSILSETSAL